MKRFISFPYIATLLAGIAYIAIDLLTPLNTDAETYGLSSSSIHVLQITLVLPVIAIWFIALWGSLQFKDYAKRIQDGNDGQGLYRVSVGLLTLVVSLVVGTLFGALAPAMLQAGHTKPWTIFTNYFTLVSSLVAFILIAQGAWKLAGLVHYRGINRGRVIALFILLVAGIAYGWLLGTNPYRMSSPHPAQITPYYMADWLIALTLVIPYLVTWYLGLFAAICINAYQRYSPGLLYRRALSRLSVGLVVIIAASLMIQLITALSPSLTHLGLAAILLLLYLLVGVYGVGHILVASGARKLARIEEVA